MNFLLGVIAFFALAILLTWLLCRWDGSDYDGL